MISKLVTQRSGEALVRLSFFQRVVFWCQKKKKEKKSKGKRSFYCDLGKINYYCAFSGEILSGPKMAVGVNPEWFSGNTWTSSSGSEAHCFATVLNSRFVSFSTFMFKLANVILRWLDKNTTKNKKKHTHKSLFVPTGTMLCGRIELRVVGSALDGLKRASSASHGGGRGRWQKAVNFSSFIHFFCSTVFDVLFSIYLQLYWQCKCTSCDSDAGDPSAEAFVSSVKKERWTLEPFACRGTSVKQWSCWWWQYCGLTTKKKRINNNVDNVLVSQLLIKATYFLYRFNYLFCHIELINLRLLLSSLLEMQRERKS